MTPLGAYLVFLWRCVEGPRLMILLTSGLAGLASGASIAAINSGIETWAEGRVPWQPVALFVVSQVVWLLASYYAQFRSARMVSTLVFDMRTAGVRRVARTSLARVEQLTVGKILAMLQHDTHAIGNSVAQIVTAMRGVVTVAFTIVYLSLLSPSVALLALFAIVVGVCAYLYQERRVRCLAAETRRSNADFHDAVHDLVSGSKESRFHAAGEASHIRQIERLGARGRTLTARSDFLSFTSASVTHLVLIGVLGLIAFLPPDVIDVTGVPVLQAITVMLYLVNGVESVVSAAAPITRGRVAHREYARLWDMLAPEPRSTGAQERPGQVTLEARGLIHAYSTAEGDFRLGPLDLSFRAPELVFITGGNGSGKTTLLKCLTGLYAPHAGEVAFNGQAVTDETLPRLRGAATAVFHDDHLFARLYGHDLRGKRARIADMLEAFGLGHKVQLGSRGFTTTTRLSTGQRKRLGLIASLLLDRPILVLDEFGAEQDPKFRDHFYRRILPDLRDEGRLILAVTHDDRYFDGCDRRIHLEYGRVSEIYCGSSQPGPDADCRRQISATATFGT